jgi:hypothetical protein
MVKGLPTLKELGFKCYWFLKGKTTHKGDSEDKLSKLKLVNGVSERKNRTIMNMVRCMLSENNVPKRLWPEAVHWLVHILNRCPTLAVRNMRPEEAWCRMKPSLHHFRIFECIAYVHVPDNPRKKLDGKRKFIFS